MLESTLMGACREQAGCIIREKIFIVKTGRQWKSCL